MAQITVVDRTKNGTANPASPANLENIVLDQAFPNTVHLKFPEGTDLYAALNEILNDIRDFYIGEFSSGFPYKNVTNAQFRFVPDRNGTTEQGYLSVTLEGEHMEWRFGTNLGKSFKQTQRVQVGFFHVSPSGMDGFDYKLDFSRRIDDFSVNRFDEDPYASRQDASKFLNYARERMAPVRNV